MSMKCLGPIAACVLMACGGSNDAAGSDPDASDATSDTAFDVTRDDAGDDARDSSSEVADAARDVATDSAEAFDGGTDTKTDTRADATSDAKADAGDAASDGSGTDVIGDAGSETTAPDSVVVPLTVVTRNSGGGLGLVVSVGIGSSTPLPLLVDTGSAGVHVLAEDISASSITRTGKASNEIYVDGTELVGEEATAFVSFGTGSTSAPITIHVIDRIDCISSKPSCPAAGMGSGFFKSHGMSGIVGIGASNAVATPSVFSPIAQLAGNLSSGFIVHAGPFGSTAGTLTLGLTTTNDVGFSTIALTPQSSPLPNGAPAWEDASISVCYTLEGLPSASKCGSSIFDTGATATFWNASVPSSMLTFGALSPGSHWSAKIAGALDWSFTVGSPAKPGLDMVIPSPGSFNTNLGIGIFFAFDVAYDLRKGTLGTR